jgi:hypothetical protein
VLPHREQVTTTGPTRHSQSVLVLCAGDRRVDAERLGLSPAPADRVREVTGFSIGGVPRSDTMSSLLGRCPA